MLIVVLVQSVDCGRLAQCDSKGKMKNSGIFLHFLDEFVIFQVEFVGISVVFIILVSVNVAMKHLTENKIPIVVFQRIQRAQRIGQM